MLVKSSCFSVWKQNQINPLLFAKLYYFFVINRAGGGKNCLDASLYQNFHCVRKREEAVAVSHGAFQIGFAYMLRLGTRSTKLAKEAASSARHMASLAAPTRSC